LKKNNYFVMLIIVPFYDITYQIPSALADGIFVLLSD
jgi:hypothetical protein